MPQAFRKNTRSGYIKTGSRTTRIAMGQPAWRPVHIRTKNWINRSVIHPNPWWWILHRRGVYRPKVGANQLEAPAVSKELVRGTLPERITYQWLVDAAFVPEIDFSFQSSLEGGRLELGGIVVDFLFSRLRLVLQVQGPTHTQWLRVRKDEEQRSLLESMGYSCEYVDEATIYDEPKFEQEMRRIFNLGTYYGGGGGNVMGAYEPPEDGNVLAIDQIQAVTNSLLALFQQIQQERV